MLPGPPQEVFAHGSQKMGLTVFLLVRPRDSKLKKIFAKMGSQREDRKNGRSEDIFILFLFVGSVFAAQPVLSLFAYDLAK